MAAIDQYDIEARYAPSLVSSVPFILLGYYYLLEIDGKFWDSVVGVTAGSLGLTTAVFLVIVSFCRGLGKLAEEHIFRHGLSFPTTTLLLDSDSTLSVEMKKRVIQKIRRRFNIDLRHSTVDNQENRKRIHEAVGQIRRVFYKNNDMLLKRNIQFGFTKNLFGGSVIAVVVALIAIVISLASSNQVAALVSIILLIIYLLVSLISLPLIRFTAKHYARCLYDEFIAL